MSVGIMGYLTFGDLVSSQFTLNMPKELYASEIATWTTVREETSLIFLCYYTNLNLYMLNIRNFFILLCL